MSVKNAFQVTIPKRNLHCVASGVRFISGMEYYSLVFENEEEEVVREDYTVAAWATHGKKRQEEVNGTNWKGRVPERKEDKPTARFHDEKALALLKEDLQEKDADLQAEAFVLALFLRRRKALIHRKEVKRKKRGYILYEVNGTEEMLTVPTFTLHELQTDKIQQTIADKLLGSEDEEPVPEEHLSSVSDTPPDRDES